MKKLLSVFLIMSIVSCGVAYANNLPCYKYYGYYIEPDCDGTNGKHNCVEEVYSFTNTIVVIWLNYQYHQNFKQLIDAKARGLNILLILVIFLGRKILNGKMI